MARPGPSPDEPTTAVGPPEWEVDVVAADGATVHLRPISPDDAPRLLAMNERISDESLYYRFFSHRRTIRAEELDHLVTVDHHDRVALVAELGDDVIAVGRYDTIGHGTAEVAFLVEDAHQHRGLGTLLLEHLAIVGRRNGLDRFTAITLPDNRRMLGVFRSAGFRVERRFEDGNWVVTFPIDHLDPEPLLERERRADAAAVTRLLEPGSIAVIGASPDPGGHGHLVVANLLAHGFTGTTHPVHPDAGRLAGLEVHPTIGAVPGPVDVAVVAVGPSAVHGVVQECGRAGVGAVVVLTTGVVDHGPGGGDRARLLAELVRRHGMRLLGPGSMGALNTNPEVGLHASFADVDVAPGPVALLSQSGMLAVAALGRAAELGLGLSSFVSVGDKVDLSGNDVVQYWAGDPRTRAIGLYLESFGNPRKFSRIARRTSSTTPIVAVKGARGPAGGDDDIVEALFRQSGVVRVDGLEQMFDTLRVLVDCPLPGGRRVAVVANVGGAGVLCVDACAANGLVLAQPSPGTVERLVEAGVPPQPVGRPLEIALRASGATWRAVIEALLADDGVDAVLANHHAVAATPVTEVAAALVHAVDVSEGKPLIAALSPAEGVGPTLVGAETPARIPVFSFPEPAAAALGRAADHADWRATRHGTWPSVHPAALSALGAWLTERAADGAVELTRAEIDRLLDAVGLDASARRTRRRGAPPPRAQADSSPLGPSRPGVAARRTLGLVVEVVQHDSFGPLVTATLSGAAPAGAARPGRRLAPLTDQDAASLLRHLPGIEGVMELSDAETDALVVPITRIGALAGDVEQLDRLIVDLELDVTGVTVTPRIATVRPVAASPEFPARQLRDPGT